MTFKKKWMKRTELIREGMPEALLDRIWNTPRQRVAVKMDPNAKNSHIVFDTDELAKFLAKETDIEQLKRGIA